MLEAGSLDEAVRKVWVEVTRAWPKALTRGGDGAGGGKISEVKS